MHPQYYDRDGVPLSLEQWGVLFGDDSYRRVMGTVIVDGADPARGYTVSTVWLGQDQQFGAGPPLIFESMVFAATDGDELDEDTRRYPTAATARAGHTEMVVQVAALLTDPIVMHTH